MFSRLVAARRLHVQYKFDWIEIQSDEGIDIGIQRFYPKNCILRVHTTLAQMIEHKQASPTPCTRAYLSRERQSLEMARRILVSTDEHGSELSRLFPLRVNPTVLPLGLAIPLVASEDDTAGSSRDVPTFLIVGSLDRRKGSDRLVPALEAYVLRHGPCRCVLVASNRDASYEEFGFGHARSEIEFVWREGLDDASLLNEYREASALLHLARYESFGYPPVEAAAMGIPIVATATGAAIDLLSGDLGEFLVDGDDPDAVAEALHRVIRRPDVGPILRDRYLAHYTRERMVDSYLAVLDAWASDQGRRR